MHHVGHLNLGLMNQLKSGFSGFSEILRYDVHRYENEDLYIFTDSGVKIFRLLNIIAGTAPKTVFLLQPCV